MIEIRGGKILQRQWRMRPIAALSVTDPVEDTWYTVLPTTSDCLVQFIAVRNYNDASHREIEIKITCDGEVLTTSDNVNYQWEYVHLSSTSDELATAISTATLAALDFPWYAQSMKVEIRRTSTWSSGKRLQGRVRYWTL